MPVDIGAHGPLGVQRGSLVACMASPCDATGARKTTSVTARLVLMIGRCRHGLRRSVGL